MAAAVDTGSIRTLIYVDLSVAGPPRGPQNETSSPCSTSRASDKTTRGFFCSSWGTRLHFSRAGFFALRLRRSRASPLQATYFFVEVELELAAWAAGAGFGDGADDFCAAGACFGAMQSFFSMYEGLCGKGSFNVRSTKFVHCTKMSMYESIFVQMYEFKNVLTPLSYSVSKCVIGMRNFPV
jgi:hypothetical protein